MKTDIGPGESQCRPTVEGPETKRRGQIVEAMVASALGVSLAAVREPGRGVAPVAFARQVAAYLSHTRLGWNCAAAGRFFHRDRTTIAHACKVIEEKRENPTIDSIIDCLERAIDIHLMHGGTA